MTQIRDSIYYEQLARKARQLASNQTDPMVAIKLRETAVKHARFAKKLNRQEAVRAKQQNEVLSFLRRLKK